MMQIGQIRKMTFWLGLALPIFALLATVWVTHIASGQVTAAFGAVTHTYKVLNLLEETQAHAADTETGQRGYLLTGREDYFALYDTAMAAANNDLQQLKTLVQDNPAEEKYLNELGTLITNRLGPNLTAAAFKNEQSNQSAVALTDVGRDTMNQIRSLLFKMREGETDLLTARQQEAESQFAFDQMMSLALVAVTAIALFAVVAIVLRLEHLRQIVTICAWTGQVKYEGEWIRMEDFLKQRFGLSVSHGLSQAAAEKMAQEIRQAKSPPESS